MLRLWGDVALPVNLPRPWGVCVPRGQGREAALCCPLFPSSAERAHYTAKALPSHSYSPLLEELSHSKGDGRTSPFHSEFHNTGLLLENLPLENGKIYPFLGKRFMFGIWLVMPFSNQTDTRWSYIHTLQEVWSHLDHGRVPPCPEF